MEKLNFKTLKEILTELENSKKLFKKYNWPIIDVTRKSVEETAASIIKILDEIEEVLIETDDGTNLVFDKYIDPKSNPLDRKLHPEEISLTPYAGKKIKLILMTKSGPNNSSMYDTAGWGEPRIVHNS